MKFFLSLTLMGAFCTQNASSYITSIPPIGSAPWKKSSFAQPREDVKVNDVFREEYEAWAKQYGKATNEHRFENFKLNYMLQMQHNKRTGTFNDLNEYGDMTAKEFETGRIDDVDTTYNNKYETEVETAVEECKEEEEPDNYVEVELVDSIPSMNPMDSGRIPRKTQFSDTTPRSPPNYSNPSNRQRPGKVNVDYTQARSNYNYANPNNRQRAEKINVDYTRATSNSDYFNRINRKRKVNVDWSPSKPREASDRKTTYTRWQGPNGQRDPNQPRVVRQDQPRPNPPRRPRRYVRVGPDPII